MAHSRSDRAGGREGGWRPRRWCAVGLASALATVVVTFGLVVVPIATGAVGAASAATTGTIPTATGLSTSVVSSVNGQPVTLTATVTVTPPATGTPTTGILFYDGSNVLGAALLVNGKGSLTTSGLAIGPHSLIAHYIGDPSFAPSTSSAVSLTVGKANAAVSLTSSVPAPVFGQPVTFTATVGAVAPGTGVPGGPITILDGSTTLATLTPVGGKVTFTAPQLTVGVHRLTAAFAGGPFFFPSTSPVLVVAVSPASTTTVLSVSRAATLSGQSLTLTATVAAAAPGSGIPSAPVGFSDGSTVIAVVKPIGGQATYTTAMLSVGSHQLSAISSGGPNYLASTSPSVSVTVTSCGCDWPEFRAGPDHLGTNPAETALGAETVNRLAPLWSDTTTGDVLSSPVVSGGVVYVGTADGRILAADAATGAVRWTVPTGARTHASPAVAGGIVYEGSDDGTFRAIDALTGVVKWSIATGSVVDSSANVADGVVYFGGTNARIYAVDAQTGAIRWTALTGDSVHASPTVDTVTGDVYVGSTDGKMYAFDVTSGALVWSYQTGGAIAGTAAVANGLVYFPSYDGRLFVLRADTGAPVWWQQTGALAESSPAVVNGVVYLGNNGGTVFAFNALTGAPIWTFATGNQIHSSPAVANGVVYIGSMDGHLYALDAGTGAKLWSYFTVSAVTSSPCVVEGAVYVGSWDFKLHAFAVPGSGTHAQRRTLHVF
jgi:outer membrane protein assembly factor BamB